MKDHALVITRPVKAPLRYPDDTYSAEVANGGALVVYHQDGLVLALAAGEWGEVAWVPVGKPEPAPPDPTASVFVSVSRKYPDETSHAMAHLRVWGHNIRHEYPSPGARWTRDVTSQVLTVWPDAHYDNVVVYGPKAWDSVECRFKEQPFWTGVIRGANPDIRTWPT